MRQIELDASDWSSVDDLFSKLLSELGAPGWHGHNLNALWDSITSGINDLEPPYSITVRQADAAPADVASTLGAIAEIFVEAKTERGIDVSFSIC